MTACVLWAGPTTRDGYGLAEIGDLIGDGKRHRTLAHRAAWLRRVGPIPAGQVVHHRCRTRLCINVRHLELVAKDWHDDHHKRKTRCKRGHDRTDPANIWVDSKGNRHCRPCWNARRSEVRANGH